MSSLPDGVWLQVREIKLEFRDLQHSFNGDREIFYFHRFMNSFKDKATSRWDSHHNMWVLCIDMKNLNGTINQYNKISSLLTGGQMAWSDQEAESVEGMMVNLGLCLASPDPLSTRENERTSNTVLWQSKVALNKEIDESDKKTSCICFHQNLPIMLGNEYQAFLSSLVKCKLVPHVENFCNNSEAEPCYIATPEGKRIGKEYSQQKTHLCLKSDDIANALYATATSLSPEYAPLFNARYLAMKVTLRDGSLEALNVKGLLPANSRVTSSDKYESITKEDMTVREMLSFISAVEDMVEDDGPGWLTVKKPDKQTLSNLIGGVQCMDVTTALTYWKNTMVFEVHYPYNSEEVVAIAKEFLSGTIGVEGNLDVMIADQIEI